MEHTNSGARTPTGGAGKPRKKKKRSVGRRILGFFGKLLLVLFTLLCIGLLTFVLFFNIFMTYINTSIIPTVGVEVEALTMDEASTIWYMDDNTGEWRVLDTLFDTGSNRKIVEYDEIPQHLIDALVAIEDKRFWEHSGVDWEGTAAAFVKTFTTGSTRGGSTITQQMLRNVTGDNDVSVKRKIREIFRALEFEKNNSKEDILTLYLNYVYFGSGCDGIQTAAEKYFGKDVSELSLAESASIIAITNNPSLYDPLRNAEFVQEDGSVKTPRDFNKKRQETILDQMLQQGYISQAEHDAAVAEKLLFTDTEEYKALHADDPDQAVIGDTTSPYSWFTDAVVEDAIELIAEANGCSRDVAEQLLFHAGYNIYTTLDMDIQRIVDSVYEDTSNFDYPSAKGTPLDSAITIVDPYTGDVVAMAGGVGEKEYSRTLNLATARRAPGSAIKPVAVYAPAIDGDIITPASVIDDYPARLNDAGTGGYPKNSNRKYSGARTVAYGVQWSLNTVAYRVLDMLGTTNSFYFMEDNLGFDLNEKDNALAPLSMGGLTYGVTTEEMAAAFGAFANQGVYTKPRTISEIRLNDNATVLVDNASESRVAMKETTAYLMNKLLTSVVSGGTGGSASFSGMSIAGKTGTTSNNYDRYFVGYTPYYSAAVWVGYSESNEKIVASSNPAAKVWKLIMEQIHENLENKSFFERPSGITTVTVCAESGLLPGELCGSTVTAEIQESAKPTETCDCHVEVRICTDPETGESHLANDYCPDETCTTKVMLKGRTYLLMGETTTNADGTVTGGTPVLGTDNEKHLTYWQLQGTCAVHDENYVDAEPVPGDPDYVWPEDGELPGWLKPSEGGDGDTTGGDGDEEPVPGDPGYVWPTDPEPQEPSVPTEPTPPTTE